MNEQIKELRKVLGLTQQEFADKLSIKRNTIANYEIGRNEPIDAVVSLICKTFSVNESWLRSGEGEMFVKSDDNIFSQLAAQGLDEFGLAALRVYLDLKPDQRLALQNYFRSVAAALPAPQPSYAELSAQVDSEMAAELAAEKLERIAEKDAQTSSPSTA